MLLKFKLKFNLAEINDEQLTKTKLVHQKLPLQTLPKKSHHVNCNLNHRASLNWISQCVLKYILGR